MRNIFRIIKLARPLYGWVGIIAGLILFTSLLEIIAPVISKFIIDEVVLQIQTGQGDSQRLVILILLGFGLTLLGIAGMALTERGGDHFAGKLRQFLTERFYQHILALPQTYFDGQVSGKIINQLNRGINTIQEFINTATNFILPTFLQSILTVLVLAYFNTLIGLLVAVLFPIYLAISYYSSKRWGRHEVAKNELEDITRARLQEVVSNIKLVKSYNTATSEYNLVSNNLGKINKIFAKQSSEFHLLDFLRNLSLNIILVLVNLIAFYQAFRGELTIGDLVLIIQLINQARRPLFAMSYILEQTQRAEAGSKEYFSVLELPAAETGLVSAQSHELISKPTLEFSSVSFAYESDSPVLNNINFKVSSGEVVALVGPSGAGKTTLINLILKLYTPTAGQIKLSRQAYDQTSAEFIRSHVALVFQDNELFSDSIKANVMYGSASVSDAEVRRALEQAQAWEFVNNLPEGIETNIGERGVRLSGGQKQRIQIARAILRNAPILILDEATSSLDAKSEFEVQAALDNLVKDRLVIIIAHRFSTIQNATKIMVLNNHQIEAMGNPQELAKQPGIYADLLNYQIAGNQKLLEKFELY